MHSKTLFMSNKTYLLRNTHVMLKFSCDVEILIKKSIVYVKCGGFYTAPQNRWGKCPSYT